ncbi:MAG: glycosyltransferase family 4 protein [Moorea sp. SIO2I5]|nr:glycosyltransferase family 4 protein [Moorena sp. SIO2I5]
MRSYEVKVVRILLICTEKLPVPCIRGGAIQTYIDGILPYLSKFHDVSVFSVTDSDLPNQHVLNGVSYQRFPTGDSDAYYQAAAKFVAEEKFDLVILYNRPKYLPSIAAASPSSQFLLSMHNEMFHEEKIKPEVAETCLEKVRGVITVSKFIADGIADLFPDYRHKLNPVYAGVDLEKFQSRWSPEGSRRRQELLSSHGLTDRNIVVYVGRLSIKKGPHLLISALPQILEQHPSTFIFIVGSKWYGHNEENKYVRQLKKQAKTDEESIYLTGFIPPTNVQKYFLMGDIFVCASQWQEPLARVHYEAMATGLPMVTTMRGGNAEVVIPGMNGLLISDYENPDAFAEAINSLLSNKELAEKMGRYGRHLGEKYYGWERVASDISRIISDCCLP